MGEGRARERCGERELGRGGLRRRWQEGHLPDAAGGGGIAAAGEESWRGGGIGSRAGALGMRGEGVSPLLARTHPWKRGKSRGERGTGTPICVTTAA